MNIEEAVALLSASPDVEQVLQELCDLTGMGFAAVARVTEDRWVACRVLDKVAFGLEPGSELQIKTTICDEIRQSRQPVFIDRVSASSTWWAHPTPIMYGFQSYVSVPLILSDGSFFGTLCAIDPDPHTVDTEEMRAAIDELAGRVLGVLERAAA